MDYLIPGCWPSASLTPAVLLAPHHSRQPNPLTRRMPVPGHDPFEMPVPSRQAVREAGFELIEKQNPSFLFDSSVLITGRSTATSFETLLLRRHLLHPAESAGQQRAAKPRTPWMSLGHGWQALLSGAGRAHASAVANCQE
jgi:hypothetical protein